MAHDNVAALDSGQAVFAELIVQQQFLQVGPKCTLALLLMLMSFHH